MRTYCAFTSRPISNFISQRSKFKIKLIAAFSPLRNDYLNLVRKFYGEARVKAQNCFFCVFCDVSLIPGTFSSRCWTTHISKTLLFLVFLYLNQQASALIPSQPPDFLLSLALKLLSSFHFLCLINRKIDHLTKIPLRVCVVHPHSFIPQLHYTC